MRVHRKKCDSKMWVELEEDKEGTRGQTNDFLERYGPLGEYMGDDRFVTMAV